MIGDCVVDASVGIKLFLMEDGTEAAHQLFSQLTADPPVHLYVPDLFFVECGNILWKYTRRFDYPVDNARQDAINLTTLAIHSVSTANLLNTALKLAVTYGITVYDASYAALAQQLEIPLITADNPLIRKLHGSGIDCRSLTDI